MAKTVKKAKPAKATKAPAKKAAVKKATVKKAAPAKSPAKKPAAKKTTKKANSAFMKAMTPSAQLAEIIGSSALARTEAVKKIWAYIKKYNLQNPKNKRNILADDKLKSLFGKAEVTMFELAGIIGKHLK